MARTGRNSVFLVVLAFAMTLAVALPASAQDGAAPDFSVPADAPAPVGEKNIVRVLTMDVLDEGTCADGQAGPCWDVSQFAANPGDTVVLVANLLKSDGFHNIHASTESPMTAATPGPKTQQGPNLFHKVAITMPESGAITFICDVHPTTMVGKVVTPAAAAAAGGGHQALPAIGVHFLAYWVGVIAFAILFVVYGITFFLFKYNETPATTDHHDRSDGKPENKRLAAVAPLLAVILAIGAIAAVIAIAAR